MDLDLEDDIDPGIFEEESLDEDETTNMPSERIKELAVVDQRLLTTSSPMLRRTT